MNIRSFFIATKMRLLNCSIIKQLCYVGSDRMEYMDYWYVIFVETGKEDHVCNRINVIDGNKEIITLVPKRIVPERHNGVFYYETKLLYPGYVLINSCEKRPRLYQEIRKIPAVYRWLGNNGLLSTLYEYEIETILGLIDERGVIQKSYAIIENSIVKIIEGPLKNKSGIVRRIDRHKNRAKVKMSLCGVDRTIDLGIEVLKWQE